MTHFFSAEEFEQELQNCLIHFYDYAYLQDHPLVKLIVPDVTTADRIQKFRDRIIAAIERLRPPDNTPALARGTRSYDVLIMRYVEQAGIDEITDQISLSRRQFYRELSRAVASLAHILRNTDTQETGVLEEVFTIQSEIASLRQHTKRHVITDLNELLQGVVKANTILAKNHGVTIQAPVHTEQINISLDRVILRQLMVILVSTIISQYKSTGMLQMQYKVTDEDICFLWQFAKGESAQQIIRIFENQPTILTLLGTIAGRLRSCPDDNCIQLMIPIRRATILIIDDNPDVIDLFRRLLDSTIYRLLVANDGTEIDSLVGRFPVDIIFLDIMLPRVDGFEILQMLKNNVDTKDIPVIICSVLDTEELALSLGANAVISKPPSKSELDTILGQWI